jgi:predicted DNA binding CopG/RHH family protein
MRQKRFELLMPEWLKTAVKEAADKKGVTMSEYIKDTLKYALSRNSRG